MAEVLHAEIQQIDIPTPQGDILERVRRAEPYDPVVHGIGSMTLTEGVLVDSFALPTLESEKERRERRERQDRKTERQSGSTSGHGGSGASKDEKKGKDDKPNTGTGKDDQK